MSQAEITALRLQMRVLQQSLKQAQEMIALSQGKLPESERITLYEMIVKHMKEMGLQKAEQYEAIIQTTLLGLNQVAQAVTDDTIKDRLIDVIKALTITIEGSRPKDQS